MAGPSHPLAHAHPPARAARLIPVLALLLAAAARGFDKGALAAAQLRQARAGAGSQASKVSATPPPLPPPHPPPPRPAGAQLPLPLSLPLQQPKTQQQLQLLLPHPYAPRPRLARLGSLISQLQDAATAPAPSRVSTPTELPLQSHPGSSYPDSSDYYEDEDDDEDDYDFEDDYSDIDDADMDDKQVLHWTQSHQPRMSPVSQTKWATMGTRSSVDELRRSRIAAGSKNLSAMTGYTEAVDHLLRVNRDGDCKVPKPRVVQVKHEYPHPSKIYLPRCTILHQCGDDTGCCNAESLTCVPRQTHRVDLFFYTSTVGTTGPSSLQRVERLSFYNHTECGCVDRNSELLSRDRAQALRKNSRGLFQVGLQQRAERAPQLLMSCHCPSKYAVRPTSDGSCICDCFDKHRECLRLKKGKEYFSTHDRQCIQKSECKVPACEFGSYLRLAGRCPKKRERFEAWNQ